MNHKPKNMKQILLNSQRYAALFAVFTLFVCFAFVYNYPNKNYILSGLISVFITICTYVVIFRACVRIAAKKKQRRLTNKYFEARTELHQERTLKAQMKYNKACREVERFLRELQAK